MLSVAIPTFRRAAYLREALGGILEQTRLPDEIVVSDNASPDETPRVLEAFKTRFPNLRIIRQPENIGGVANWNAAINATRGDIIALVFDDDLCLPNHLERSEQHLLGHPGTDLVHAAFDTLEVLPESSRVSHGAAAWRMGHLSGVNAVAYMMVHYSWPFHPSTLVFRRSLWDVVGPFDPRFCLADTDWFLRCAQGHRIDYLREVHLVNRRHPSNWSNEVGAAGMHGEVDAMVRKYINSLGTAGVSRLTRQSLLEAWRMHHLLRVLRLAVARGRAGARGECAEALKLMARALPSIAGSLDDAWIERLGSGMAAVLSRLQAHLPGGLEKYGGLGVTMPK